MKFISNYRVCYNGRFYEAGSPFQIRDEDADNNGKSMGQYSMNLRRLLLPQEKQEDRGR